MFSSWGKRSIACPAKVKRDEDGDPEVIADVGKGQRVLVTEVTEPLKACYAELDTKGYPDKTYITEVITQFQSDGRSFTDVIRAGNITDHQYDELRSMFRKKHREVVRAIKNYMKDEKKKTIVTDYALVLYWEYYVDAQSNFSRFKQSNAGKVFLAAKAKEASAAASAQRIKNAAFAARMSALRTVSSKPASTSNNNLANLERMMGRSTIDVRTPSTTAVSGSSPAMYAEGGKRRSRKSTRKNRRNRTRKH